MSRCLSLFFVLGLVSPAVAGAQQTKVWIDCFHGDVFCTFQDELADLEQAFYDAGATEVHISTELSSDVGDGSWKLLIMILPHLPLNTPELNIYIPGFLSAGGRLVLLGDNDSEEAFNNYIRTILDSIPDHDLVLNTDDFFPGCGGAVTGDILGDPLTGGLAAWHMARVNSVSGGDALINYTNPSGVTSTLAAVSRLPGAGEIILFGDVEGFVMNCASVNPGDPDYEWASDHEPLWRNLFLDGSTSPDNDGDGFTADEDCNDSDEYVNPNAPEICDNDIDDDCDGDIDLDDADCEGVDDDDDDDTGFDDDDDVTPFNGGEGGGWGSGGGCCGSSSLAGAGSGGLAALLLLLGVGRRRRPL